jgi:hypothetical protein
VRALGLFEADSSLPGAPRVRVAVLRGAGAGASSPSSEVELSSGVAERGLGSSHEKLENSTCD